MNIFILITIGLAGGIFGGLGMGGGTLLIPLLVTTAGISQHGAQMINLVAFVPMAIIALVIHCKNGLVKFKYLLTISLPATAFAVLATFLVRNIEPLSLKRYFGAFLIVLGVYQLTSLLLKLFLDKNYKFYKIIPISKKDV